MPDQEPKLVLTKAEVERKLRSLITIDGVRAVTAERYDSRGVLYYFEVSIMLNIVTKVAEYAYTLEGDFPGLASNNITRICVTYYEQDEIVGGADLAHYYNGEWI